MLKTINGMASQKILTKITAFLQSARITVRNDYM